MFLTFLAVVVASQLGLAGVSLRDTILFLVLCVVAPLAGGRLYVLGKELGARSAASAMALDPRPPILYLRSFQDDRVTAKGREFASIVGGSGLLTLLGLVTLTLTETEEEQLAKALKRAGPVIAIGQPGEPLPGLGAARAYLNNADWHEWVHQYMSKAQLVVLRAGDTDGLWWELGSVAEQVKPGKLAILLPYDAEQYEAFRQRAESVLPCHLPDYPPGKLRPAGSIRGLLFFEPNWSPHFLKLTGFKLLGISDQFVPAFRTTFQPIYDQLRLKVRKPFQLFLNTGHSGLKLLFLGFTLMFVVVPVSLIVIFELLAFAVRILQ